MAKAHAHCAECHRFCALCLGLFWILSFSLSLSPSSSSSSFPSSSSSFLHCSHQVMDAPYYAKAFTTAPHPPLLSQSSHAPSTPSFQFVFPLPSWSSSSSATFHLPSIIIFSNAYFLSWCLYYFSFLPLMISTADSNLSPYITKTFLHKNSLVILSLYWIANILLKHFISNAINLSILFWLNFQLSHSVCPAVNWHFL